jgi:hypothetical protein
MLGLVHQRMGVTYEELRSQKGSSLWEDDYLQVGVCFPSLPLDALVRSQVWLETNYKFVRTEDYTFKDV